jgi:hypothetical protein
MSFTAIFPSIGWARGEVGRVRKSKRFGRGARWDKLYILSTPQTSQVPKNSIEHAQIMNKIFYNINSIKNMFFIPDEIPFSPNASQISKRNFAKQLVVSSFVIIM